MVWKGIQLYDVMRQAGFCAVAVMENSSGKQISLLGHYPCNQLTKDPNHCFPTITIDLDTSDG
jgi:hypothetical protein